MGCCRENKFTCGNIVSDSCVKYGGMIPDHSKLDTECDISLREILEEVCVEQEKIHDSIDLKDLGKNCLSYDQAKSYLRVNEVLLAMEQKICELNKGGNSNVSNTSLDLSKLDLKCLSSDCVRKPNSIISVIQMIIDQVCDNRDSISKLRADFDRLKKELVR